MWKGYLAEVARRSPFGTHVSIEVFDIEDSSEQAESERGTLQGR